MKVKSGGKFFPKKWLNLSLLLEESGAGKVDLR